MIKPTKNPFTPFTPCVGADNKFYLCKQRLLKTNRLSPNDIEYYQKLAIPGNNYDEQLQAYGREILALYKERSKRLPIYICGYNNFE